MLGGHLMNRAVGALNRELHQVFNVVAVANAVTECFVQDIDRRLRSYFAGLRAANSISHGKDAALPIAEKRILVQRPLIIQAAIADRRALNFFRWRSCAHSTASNSIWLSGSCLVRAIAR